MNKMKRKSIISMLLLSMTFGMFSTSCQDMLSPDSERHAYTVAEDTLYSYWGILKSLQNIAERYVILNECRGDLVDASSYVSDTIAAIVNFGETDNPELWKDGACAYLSIADYYHVINSCNAYIASCDTMRTTGTNRKYMLSEYAQVKAIRAWVYMQLLYAYGENRVPFYTDPMLTTDDINNFVANSTTKVTAQRLADELGPDLEELEWMEYDSRYGLPNYNNYGDANFGASHFIVHSSKCMFPISIVLGDLYLLSGKYADAASHYYKYINSQYCGPLPTDEFFCTGLLDDRLDYPIYERSSNAPYYEPQAVSRRTEAITCIPSNQGKLEGRVLTDVCRLFGFEAQMVTGRYTVKTDDGEEIQTSSSVILTPNYERELIPSKGYEALCDDQKYEIYVGSVQNGNFTAESLEELPGVGDARRAWIYSSGGRQWNFYVGDDRLYGKMVSKQNPGGAFSTTYPVVYRKSGVWLRYAEALNRAGFPGYAFAILKTGLCNNEDWFPRWNGIADDYRGTSYFGPDGNVRVDAGADYLVREGDSVFFYVDKVGETEKVLPFDRTFSSYDEVKEYLASASSDVIFTNYADLEAWLNSYFEQEFTAYNEANPETPMESPRQIDKAQVFWAPRFGVDSYENKTSELCTKACYYLDRREVESAANVPYLNFNQTYLRGQDYSQWIEFKEQGKLFNATSNVTRFSGNGSSDATFTIGVHQRGCGFIMCFDPVDLQGKPIRSAFDYAPMVQKKLAEAGITVSEDDIYNGEVSQEQIQDAVEDLIIDECALELAFEGSRFSDLYRVAKRRGTPDYLAKRVAKRHTGEIDEKLRSRLQNEANWFLPIPQE